MSTVIPYAPPPFSPTRVPIVMTGILQARGIVKSFEMGETDFQVLRELDFDLQAGEFVAIEGRSGEGKSTLLHILAALDSVDGGHVEFEGTNYARRTPPPLPRWLRSWTFHRRRSPADPGSRWTLVLYVAISYLMQFILFLFRASTLPLAVRAPVVLLVSGLFVSAITISVVSIVFSVLRILTRLRGEPPTAKLRNKEFGFIFQFYHLLPELNVLENTMLAPSIEFSWFQFRSRRTALRARATELLEQLNMSHRLKHRPSQLSGGERQRVAIARALMNKPKVLFADEPTGNLDAETGRQIMDVLETLHRDFGQTIVMVTHDRTLAREADRVLVLKDGRLEPAV